MLPMSPRTTTPSSSVADLVLRFGFRFEDGASSASLSVLLVAVGARDGRGVGALISGTGPEKSLPVILDNVAISEKP
jgi:hypothetical protein